ncbi:MAG: heme o synthase [Duganella sp.]
MTTQTLTKSSSRASQFWALTKPRITQMAVFCAVIGMFLASDGIPDWRVVLPATVGIFLLTSAAFVVNCLAEREIDARMARTARRPIAQGHISVAETVVFALAVGGAGMWILYTLVNPLTMWLTFITFVGYAIIYTMILKPATPQNIVIGGLSGAMPPALGWAAIANEVPAEAWLLVLIIFVWTPPHFWALALYRREDYVKSGLPMLPVTHGMEYTQLHVWLYSIALAATTVLPYVVHMSGLIYLVSAIILNAIFLRHAWKVWRQYSDQVARKAFAWSIMYLGLLFAALLVDHYIKL